VQNLRPRWDRRALALVVGAVATVSALALNIHDYENFLLLIGSVFVPLLGVLVVDYFVVSRGDWDLGEHVPGRWATLLPWGLGFVAYQLVNPGYMKWWRAIWLRVDSWLGFSPQTWMSASITSFVVAGAATGLAAAGLAAASRRR